MRFLSRRLLTVSIASAALAGAAVFVAAGRAGVREPVLEHIGADISLVKDTRLVRAKVAAGATLASLLHAEGIAVAEAADVVSRAARVFDVRRLRANRPYRIEKAADGLL